MVAKRPTTPRRTSTAQELQILHRIIETISYDLDIDHVLHEIVSVVDSVAHADEIFVYMLKGHELGLRAAKKERTTAIRDVQLKMGEGITGWVAEHKTLVRLQSKAYEDDRFHTFTNLRADKYEAMLSVPMLYHGHLIGVLNVQHKKEHKFTDREVALIQTVANATAGACENARLFEQTTLLQEALEARKVIERAKGALMKQYSLSEEQAYSWLKKRAMNLRKTMREVAEAVLISVE